MNKPVLMAVAFVMLIITTTAIVISEDLDPNSSDRAICNQRSGIWVDSQEMRGVCLNSDAALFKEGDA